MMTEQGKDNQMTAEKNAAFGKLNSDLKAGRVNIQASPSIPVTCYTAEIDQCSQKPVQGIPGPSEPTVCAPASLPIPAYQKPV